MGDKLVIGLSTTAIGMLVVFFGLVILIFCIWVMGKITSKKKRPRSEKLPVTVPARAAVPEPPVPAAEAEEEADDALIAVLTAAIACVWEDRDKGFVVRRIRRFPAQPSWQTAARDEQMYNRM